MKRGRGELRTVLVWALAGCALAVVGGCNGQAGPACHPVRGQIRWNSQPLADAQVVFHPRFAATENFPKPIGHTDGAGTFRLSTLQANDGAPAGDYVITVELRDLRQVGEEAVRDGRNLLPRQFASPQESGLRYTVKEGENIVPSLEIPPR